MVLGMKGYDGWYFLLMISPLLPDKLGLFPIYIFILAFTLLKRFTKTVAPIHKIQKRMLWLAIAFFIFYALSLLWGDDFCAGIKSVERMALFLILPALFLIVGKNDSEKSTSVTIFVTCVNLALAVCLSIAIYQASIYTGFQTWPFKYYNFTYWIGIHPGYFSLLILLSMVCTSFILKEGKGGRKAWWLSLLFQAFMLFFIGAKFAIFSFLVSLVIFLFLFKFNRKQIIMGAGVCLVLISFALFVSINSWSRIASVKDSMADRIELNKVGLNLISQKWIVGYGAGNVDEKLKMAYERFGIEEAYTKNYNIHNQYLQTFLDTGIFGFLLLGTLIFFAIKSSDNRIFAFLLLLQFITFFMIESALVRQKGVVAFVTWLLFVSLFNLGAAQTKNSGICKKRT